MHFGIKPLFCTNLSKNKHNETPNGKEFICRTVSPALSKDMIGGLDRLVNAETQKHLPLWLWFSLMLSASMGPVLLFLALFGGEPIRLDLVADGSLFTVIFAGLVYYAVRRVWKAKMSTERSDILQEVEDTCHRIRKELGVPDDAVSIDVLQFHYRNIKGKITPKLTLGKPLYHNIEHYAYKKHNTLYLCDMEHVYAIPLASLRAITSIEKKIGISGWHKNRSPEAHGAMSGQNGLVIISGYHILEIRHGGETLGIYVPSYELNALKEITNLSAGNTLRL